MLALAAVICLRAAPRRSETYLAMRCRNEDKEHLRSMYYRSAATAMVPLLQAWGEGRVAAIGRGWRCVCAP